ncbi:MAG: efflux RND transporter periplasmic adaptor subunit [candidate division NC10 bacterium]|nr:efflux RND transporter periplasmic adaptor subunit [candidate division NC10 bacterium]
MRRFTAHRAFLGKGFGLLAWLLLSIAIAGCGSDAGSPQPAAAQQSGPPPTNVMVGQVMQKTIQGEIQVIGTVEPNLSTTVSAEVSGLVERFDLREGDRVVKGQTIIAQLKRTDREIALREAEAVVARAKEEWEKLKRGLRPEEINQRKAEVEERKALVEWASKDLSRLKELHADGAISIQDLQRAEANYLAAKSRHEQALEALREAETGYRQEDVAKAAAELKRAQAVYDRIQDELKRTTIRSPITGFIVRKHTEVGQWVDEGGKIADVVDLDKVLILAQINEKEIGQLKVGDRATITVDTYPGRKFAGRTKHIVPQADPQSRAFPVKIEVANPKGELKGGMLARVSIGYGAPRPTLLVPKDAVVRQGDQQIVFVVNQQKASLQRVVTGRAVDGFLEIVDGQLKAGDAVVVTGNETLRDGAPVKIVTK